MVDIIVTEATNCSIYSINLQSDLDINECKTYIVTLFKVLIISMKR